MHSKTLPQPASTASYPRGTNRTEPCDCRQSRLRYLAAVSPDAELLRVQHLAESASRTYLAPSSWEREDDYLRLGPLQEATFLGDSSWRPEVKITWRDTNSLTRRKVNINQSAVFCVPPVQSRSLWPLIPMHSAWIMGIVV